LPTEEVVMLCLNRLEDQRRDDNREEGMEEE